MKKKKKVVQHDRELLLNALTNLYLKHWESICWQDPESVSRFIVFQLMSDFNNLPTKELLKDYKKLSGKEYSI